VLRYFSSSSDDMSPHVHDKMRCAS
jgi:hypothetical protein